jgi:hypothetical protein
MKKPWLKGVDRVNKHPQWKGVSATIEDTKTLRD